MEQLRTFWEDLNDWCDAPESEVKAWSRVILICILFYLVIALVVIGIPFLFYCLYLINVWVFSFTLIISILSLLNWLLKD